MCSYIAIFYAVRYLSYTPPARTNSNYPVYSSKLAAPQWIT
jgi:hypothetical protein